MGLPEEIEFLSFFPTILLFSTTKLPLMIIDFLTETKSSSLIVDPADFEFFRVRTLNCFLFFSFKLNNFLFLDLFLVIILHSLGFKHLILMRLKEPEISVISISSFLQKGYFKLFSILTLLV